MVFVPVPSFAWSQLGLGTELPRAVPLDALTAGLSVLVPATLLQKLLLLGALVSAGCGAAALVPTRFLLPRLVAATAAVWNPFVAERLVLGHWGLLIGYGALPWLVGAVRRHGEGRGRLAPVLVLLAVSAVTPTGGLVSLVVLGPPCCGIDPALAADRPAAARMAGARRAVVATGPAACLGRSIRRRSSCGLRRPGRGRWRRAANCAGPWRGVERGGGARQPHHAVGTAGSGADGDPRGGWRPRSSGGATLS